jgi:hypothetical protein
MTDPKKITRVPVFRIAPERLEFPPPPRVVGFNVFVPAPQKSLPVGLVYFLIGVAFAVGRLVTLALVGF